MTRTYRLELPAGWVRANNLEHALRRSGRPLSADYDSAHILLPANCKVMIDAGIRLLSLANQLAHYGRNVTIEFGEGQEGTMGYLSRIGFFTLLNPSIRVLPTRPEESESVRHRGKNTALVEFRPISPSHLDRTIPKQLTDSLKEACSGRSDNAKLMMAAYTVFGELIDNILEHSDTVIDGYAGLQVYPRGGLVIVAVSDSGRGILDTIRPSLIEASLSDLSDPEVLVYLFNHGLSRYGVERGCGLRQSAEHALKFNAQLYLRLPTSSLHLVPGQGGYQKKNMAYYETSLPLVRGTHVAFEFQLDN